MSAVIMGTKVLIFFFEFYFTFETGGNQSKENVLNIISLPKQDRIDAAIRSMSILQLIEFLFFFQPGVDYKQLL